ncbi:MAG TPA: hypothetical protein VLE73_03545 [Candidatus Saccharimonadales bacterium]|nr:hypothetical protein [Candidatus Saccharimonadales bacterium]
MNHIKQAGFSAVEALVILVVLAGLAGVGYVAVHRMQTPTADNAVSVNKSSTSSEPTAPAITTTSDLNQAQQVLDSSELDAADTDLNAQLNSF